MRCHRLSRPDGAHFTRRVITYCKDKIDLRCTGRGELIPAFAAKILRGQIHALQKFHREAVDLALWETAGTKAAEPTAAPVIQKRFGEDAAGGVAGA